MIDWVSFSLPYDGPPLGVSVVESDLITGEVFKSFPKSVPLEGSYSSKVIVRAMGGRLEVSGNPVKFLTGQNVFGTNDLKLLVHSMIDKVYDHFGMERCLMVQQAIAQGNIKIGRVDCTFHFDLGTDDNVRRWLQAMESCCHVRYRGRGHYDDTMCSLMFGLRVKEGQKPKGSTYSSFKFYNKSVELRKNPPKVADHVLNELNEYALGKVRAEALYRFRELDKLGFGKLRSWGNSTAWKLNKDWMERMDISNNVRLLGVEENKLPNGVRAAYRLWVAGEDVRTMFSKATVYRHRKVLLDYGVDILAPGREQSQDRGQVVPVMEVLQASPCSPEYETSRFLQLLQAA